MKKIILAVLLATSLNAQAVTGSLSFGDTTNYFDPTNGYVPAGYLNKAGTTVDITSLVPKYGFNDGYMNISADFTKSQFTVVETPTSTTNNASSGWEMLFTNLPVNYLTKFTSIKNTFFDTVTYVTPTPTSLQLDYVGGAILGSGSIFSMSIPPTVVPPPPVPEPSTFLMMLSGLAIIGYSASKKHR